MDAMAAGPVKLTNRLSAGMGDGIQGWTTKIAASASTINNMNTDDSKSNTTTVPLISLCSTCQREKV